MAAVGVAAIIDAVAVVSARVKIIVADAVVMTWLLFFLEIMPHLSAKHECNVLMHSSGKESKINLRIVAMSHELSLSLFVGCSLLFI